MRTQPGSPNSLPARTRKPRRASPSVRATSSTPTSTSTKFACDGYGVGAGLAQALGEPLAAGLVREPARLDELGVAQAGAARRPEPPG